MIEFSQRDPWPLEYKVRLWVRREQSRRAIAWLRRVAHRISARMRASAELTAHKKQLAETLQGLQMLDDRMLADIGLARGQVEFALRSGARRGVHVRRAIVA